MEPAEACCVMSGSGDSVLVVLHGPLDDAQSQAICDRAQLVLAAGSVRGVVCDLQGVVDLSVIDMLARLRLLTRRSGATLRMLSLEEDVESLLAYCGLDDAVNLWRDC